MRVVFGVFLAIVSIATLACTGGETEPTSAPATSEPTYDIQATVEAGIAATIEADASTEATVTARLESPRTAEPSPTPTSTPQPTPAFTPQPTPRPTVASTATPLPTSALPPTATATPRPTPALQPIPTPQPSPTPVKSLSLPRYASMYAGGPGAIYVGDLNQLVGPAHLTEQGDFDGGVPIDALLKHVWIYESDHYRSLLEKANLTDPTPLTSRGEEIVISLACVNPGWASCKLLETFLAPNVYVRTDGQLKLHLTSFPELGMSGTDVLSSIYAGSLISATVYSPYAVGVMPALDIQNLYGIYSSSKQEFEVTQSIIGDIEDLVTERTRSVVLNSSWYAHGGQYLFCKERLDSSQDFKGKKTFSHSPTLSEWLDGMGVELQFVDFAEVYTALERGFLDCAVTRPDEAFAQKWYEVSDYMIGPLIGPNFPFAHNVINGWVWENIPSDLRQILIEEAAKSELEALRLTAIQSELALIKNQYAGLELIPFSEEVKLHSFNKAVVEHVLPSWVKRIGNASNPIISTFNRKVGPVVGLHIDPYGQVIKVPITKGTHAGKTVEQVLSE